MGMVRDEMERRLVEALSPTWLEIIDDSERHLGHAGHSGSGESHFTVRVASAAFAGKSRVDRQRAVYAAVGDLIAPDRIHALAIEAQEALSEVRSQSDSE
jgi:BolA protein